MDRDAPEDFTVVVRDGFEDEFFSLIDTLELTLVDRECELDPHLGSWRESGRIPPSLHATCARRTRPDERLHLRYLVWENADYPNRMRAFYRVHEALLAHLQRHEAPFAVPELLEYSTDGPVWDLTRHIDGHELPWNMDEHGQLTDRVERAADFVGILAALQGVHLPDVPNRNFAAVASEFTALNAWAVEHAVVSETSARRLQERSDLAFDAGRSQEPLFLTHPDFHPANLVYGDDGKRYMLDYDSFAYSRKGEAFGRFFMVMSKEPVWQREVLRLVNPLLTTEAERNDFAVMAALNCFRYIRQLFELEASQRGCGTPEELEENDPVNGRNVRAQMRTLELIDCHSPSTPLKDWS